MKSQTKWLCSCRLRPKKPPIPTSQMSRSCPEDPRECLSYQQRIYTRRRELRPSDTAPHFFGPIRQSGPGRQGSGDGGIQARVIGRRLSSIVVWKPVQIKGICDLKIGLFRSGDFEVADFAAKFIFFGCAHCHFAQHVAVSRNAAATVLAQECLSM